MTDTRSRIAEMAVWAVILAFVATFAFLSVRRHMALATNGMDLGNVDQALWNTAHGDFLGFTNMAPVHSRLALHVEPILMLFVPLYWLGLGGPVSLLIGQAVVVGLGALPLFWLARDTLAALPRPLALVFPVAYLLLPALESAVLSDFHAVALAPTFLLFAFFYMVKGRPGRFALSAVLAMACKEDMALTVAMLGLYALLTRRWRFGVPALLGGLAWFVVALFVVQPAFSHTGGNVQAARYAWLGGSMPAILETFVRRPELVWDHVWRQSDLSAYLSGLLLPTGLLAALSPLTWLPALPSLAINLLSDDPFTWRLEEFHYAVAMAPFVLVSAVYGVRVFAARLVRRRTESGTAWPAAGRHAMMGACGLLLLASLGYHWGRGFSPLARAFQSWPVGAHEQSAAEVFGQVPPDAAVFAQSNLNPHVSERAVLYQEPAVLNDLLQGDGTTVVGGLPAPEYLLFDVSTLVNQDDFQSKVVMRLLGTGGFSLSAADDGLLLLKRAASPQSPLSGDRLPERFFNFVRAPDDTVRYPIAAEFGDGIRLLGFDLRFNRAEEVQPVLTFEALRSLDEDYFIALYLLDAWGVPLGATMVDQPALVWYPTHRWQPGERVRITFNTLPWYTRDLPSYRIALGVMHGRDPWQVAARLAPALAEDAPYAVRLPDAGSLLELARFDHVFGMPEGAPPERQFRAPRPQHGADASLGGQIRWLGYDMLPPTCGGAVHTVQADGCWFGVVLYWQAEASIATDYKVFVHVVGQSPSGEARIWAQRDAPPDSGAYSMRRWRSGEVVPDPVRVELPPDMPAGNYDLIVGVYDPETGTRLPVMTATGEVVDDKIVLPGALAVPQNR